MLLPALAAALDGTGPAIAPVPVVSASVSATYITSVLQAVRADDRDAPLESDEVALVLATSGSTGNPKGVLLTAPQLTALTVHVHGPVATPQWIVALPVTSMAGVNVVVRALASGREPVAMESVGGAAPFTPSAFHSAVTAATASTDDVRVSLVPAQLARLLSDEAGVEGLRACRQVLVGGAATRAALIAMSGDLGIVVTTTYGSTETSGGCVFDGRPLPGVSVTSTGSPGVLTIRGPTVALGYRGDPRLTAERFTDGGFVTPDLGTVDADGAVDLMGRADDIVTIKGVNVSPAAVERTIADLPDVVAAAAVAIDVDGEPLLCAFIEVREEAPDVERAVVEAVSERLGAIARPRRIHRVARLPHLPNGKVDRPLLRRWASEDDRPGLSGAGR